MDADSPLSANPNTVQVLLPYALDGAYSYTCPDGVALAAGDYVRVPLGPRESLGVVWDESDGADGGEVGRSELLDETGRTFKCCTNDAGVRGL